MGKAFVGEEEAQIEKDLREKFEEVDMPVSFWELRATDSLVVVDMLF